MNLLTLFLLISISIASGYLLVVCKDILMPLVLAFFLWSLINALADIYQRYIPIRRFWCIAASIVTFLLIAWFPIQLISSTIPGVIAESPKYQHNLLQLADRIFEYFNVDQGPVLEDLRNRIDFPELVSSLASALGSLTGNVLMVLLYVAFLLAEQGSFSSKIAALFKTDSAKSRVNFLIESVYERVRTYIWVKTILSVMTGVLSYLILKIVGVDFAEFWAVCIFFLNFIPNIGSILGVAFPAVLTILQFDSLYPFLIVIVGAGAIQFVIGNVLEPRMMGDSLNLSPFIIILSLVIWGSIWGLVGAFLSVPLMVVLAIVLAEFEQTRPIAIILSSDGNVEHK